MSAEQLIGLEAAIRELSELYVVARGFGPLKEAAERELLPETSTLAAELRAHLRKGSFDDAAVDAAARRIAGLRREWNERLERLRAGDLYRRALTAWEAGDNETLADVLPRLCTGVEIARTTGPLFYGVSLSARRRPGALPFVTPEACANTIARLRDDGIPADAGGEHWWETELGSLSLVDDAGGLDTPVALRIDSTALTTPVFAVRDAGVFRLYGPRFRLPFTVTVQEDVADEWWQAFEETYEDWRGALVRELERRGIPLG